MDSARANLAAAEARLADLKAGPKQADILAAEAAVEQARSAVWAADDRKDIANSSAPDATKYAAGATSVGATERAADAAVANYEAAVARLNLLRSMPLPADLQSAQSSVDAAKAALMAADFRVDQMKRGATKEDLQQAEGAVSAAEATLVSTEARLQQVRDGATEEDLSIVEAAVTQAEKALALARKPFRDEDLAQARAGVVVAEQQHAIANNPYTEHDLAMARATVKQAEAALEMAEIAHGEMVLRSPIDGVVSEKLQSVGALIGPQSPIVSVITGQVEMVLGVEETQIGQVQEGQKAEITVAAYPGATFQARVSSIAPSADPKSRTFQVKVSPEAHGGKLKPGMFAQAKIVTQEKEAAVLVPKEAVVSRGGETSVFVLKGDAVEMRPVVLGLRHNGTVEVVSGLDAGEEVVVAGQNDLRDGDRVNKV